MFKYFYDILYITIELNYRLLTGYHRISTRLVFPINIFLFAHFFPSSLITSTRIPLYKTFRYNGAHLFQSTCTPTKSIHLSFHMPFKKFSPEYRTVDPGNCSQRIHLQFPLWHGPFAREKAAFQ